MTTRGSNPVTTERTAEFVPTCMEAADLAGWQELNLRVASPADRAARPCTDCTLEHAAEMRAVGRCNGTTAGAEEDTEMDQPEPTVPQPRRRRVSVETVNALSEYGELTMAERYGDSLPFRAWVRLRSGGRVSGPADLSAQFAAERLLRKLRE